MNGTWITAWGFLVFIVETTALILTPILFVTALPWLVRAAWHRRALITPGVVVETDSDIAEKAELSLRREDQ